MTLTYDVQGTPMTIECESQEVLDTLKPVIQQAFPDAVEQAGMEQEAPEIPMEEQPAGIQGMACGTVGRMRR